MEKGSLHARRVANIASVPSLSCSKLIVMETIVALPLFFLAKH
jgi:hypothetical protein